MVPPARHAIELVGDGAGRAVAAADVGCAGAQDRRRPPPGPGGSRIPAPRRPSAARTTRLALVAIRLWWFRASSSERLDELGLDGRGADRQDRLTREDRRALRHGVDIAREAESLADSPETPRQTCRWLAEIGEVLLGKMQVVDIVDHLLQARRDGKAAAVRHVGGKRRQNRQIGPPCRP